MLGFNRAMAKSTRIEFPALTITVRGWGPCTSIELEQNDGPKVAFGQGETYIHELRALEKLAFAILRRLYGESRRPTMKPRRIVFPISGVTVVLNGSGGWRTTATIEHGGGSATIGGLA